MLQVEVLQQVQLVGAGWDGARTIDRLGWLHFWGSQIEPGDYVYAISMRHLVSMPPCLLSWWCCVCYRGGGVSAIVVVVCLLSWWCVSYHADVVSFIMLSSC